MAQDSPNITQQVNPVEKEGDVSGSQTDEVADNNPPQTDSDKTPEILVAGDVCLDVVGVPMPAKSGSLKDKNWQLTGETRTHFLPGGAILLAELVRAAVGNPSLVTGPRPKCPFDIDSIKEGDLLDTESFKRIAPRLSRNEVVHSLLGLKLFPTTAKPKEKNKTLRVEQEAGYSGPNKGEPCLEVEYKPSGTERIVVIDDTGNHFRDNTPLTHWPELFKKTEGDKPLVFYKLHRPLPGSCRVSENSLWETIKTSHKERRVVVISADDLRAEGIPICQGLSWERTALEVVWQLQNAAAFSELAECPWLVIRLGLDGAILWYKRKVKKEDKGKVESKEELKASLIYDPKGIEGSFSLSVPGNMVGTGSVFTAALINSIYDKRRFEVEQVNSDDLMFVPPKDVEYLREKAKKDLPNASEEDIKNEINKRGAQDEVINIIQGGVKAGLLASRRFLEAGYGKERDNPEYPGQDFFEKLTKELAEEDSDFGCQDIPIIPGALSPDRGGWRLLNQIFSQNTSLLNRAVLQKATNRKPSKMKDVQPEPEELEAEALLDQAPLGVFGKLSTYDRREMEHYRSLHTLLKDYLSSVSPPRPLSFAVFGPPGAGKSFGVKEVAASLEDQPGCREVETLTFNLSLYQSPEELAGAFHLVRDVVLEGKVPLVFFDEFDTTLEKQPLGWLRHFLAPMQDGTFLDREAPHPIGQAIFVFAGGTCDTYRDFATHFAMGDAQFKQVKGPDFLSRLRATLDIPSLNFLTACSPVKAPNQSNEDALIQEPGTFDPFGPIESLPCEAAILLRRATILSYNLKEKAPNLVRDDESLAVNEPVLRAMLRMPAFKHGNRSFEALLDMSHLAGIESFTASQLPATFQLPLHVDAKHFEQLIAVDYPHDVRYEIAQAIHKRYLEQRTKGNKGVLPKEAACKPWEELSEELRESNLKQADDIATKLRSVNLWYRKRPTSVDQKKSIERGWELIEPYVEELARAEHDRWIAEKRCLGWIAGKDTSKASREDSYRIHNCLFPWEMLSKEQKDLDYGPIQGIPTLLADAGYEIIKPETEYDSKQMHPLSSSKKN